MTKQGKHSKNSLNFFHLPCARTLLDHITHDSDYYKENTMLTMLKCSWRTSWRLKNGE